MKKSIYSDAYNDLCLKILSHKSVLAFIMKECLDEYHNSSLEEIIDCIEKDLSNHSDKILGFTNDLQDIDFDLFFGAAIPNSNKKIDMLINLEAQRNVKTLPYRINNRALFYEGYELVYQYERFIKNQNYDELRKVVSAWICFDAPSKEEENSITYFHLTKDVKIGYNKIEPEEYDKLCIIIIYLGEDESSNQLLSYLTTLFSNRISFEEKIKIFEEKYEFKINETFIKEVHDMFDLASKIQEEGMMLGITQGITEANVQNVKNLMFSCSCTLEEAFNLLKLSNEEQEKIRNVLNQ